MHANSLYCFELTFESDNGHYSERTIFAGSLAAAIVVAYRLATKDTRISISEHQPIMVDGDGVTIDGTFAGGASIGALFEATHMGYALTIQEAREHVMFRYSPRPSFSPRALWSVGPTADYMAPIGDRK